MKTKELELELELASCWLVTGLLAAKTNDATQHILEERTVYISWRSALYGYLGGVPCKHILEESTVYISWMSALCTRAR